MQLVNIILFSFKLEKRIKNILSKGWLNFL